MGNAADWTSTLPLFSRSIQFSRVGDAVSDQKHRSGVFVVPPLVIVARVGLCSAILNRKSLALAGGRNRGRYWQTRFQSPVSYWDHRHFGSEAARLELLLAIGLMLYLVGPWLYRRASAMLVRRA